ncbi:hypothetical protein [Sporomusa acidovorans]|uniref:Uncharacterized protein n=1 Tax=Sporomusa acidovorans (strain ATCC 49682 / DSM 3132 / Mol) TaxID=1123286 RepID=A0ABZ3J1P5_SPOA4|nr:hypothetical protein [Sporomusa acidovorans]OZC13653.1 hypothetical protein SPACI_56340 [Sporomusa acidovorans DSM 3132]SDE86016.1 hypothetical protein SAMN04488499_102418 [Sporomusa acidovorans]
MKKATRKISIVIVTVLEGFNRKARKKANLTAESARLASKLSTRKIFDCLEEGNRGLPSYGISIGHFLLITPNVSSFLIKLYHKKSILPIFLYEYFLEKEQAKAIARAIYVLLDLPIDGVKKRASRFLVSWQI